MKNLFRKLTIKTRLCIWFGGLFVLLSVIFFIGYTRVGVLKEVVEELKEETEELHVILDASISLSDILMPVNDYFIIGADINEGDNFEQLVKIADVEVEKLNALSLNREDERAFFLKIKEKYDFFKQKSRLVFVTPMNELSDFEKGGVLMEELDKEMGEIVFVLKEWRDLAKIEISAAEEEAMEAQSEMVVATFSLSFSAIIISFIFLIILIKIIKRPISNLVEGAQKIRNGDLSARVKIESQDELGELSIFFNKMASDLESLQARQKKYEEDIEKNLRQLQILNKTMIGRELKMAELKKKIKEGENPLKIDSQSVSPFEKGGLRGI